MNGSGTPVAGKNEHVTDIFKNAWKPIENVMPTAKSFPYISGQRDAIIKPLSQLLKHSLQNLTLHQ